jgi:glycosyltransferase involved in cell wall biosynthesis
MGETEEIKSACPMCESRGRCEKKPMRVAIFSTMPPNAYSGGRYAALMTAEALALGGHDSYVVANNKPLFHDDLSCTPCHERVHFHISPDFSENLPDGPFDLVFFIPALRMSNAFRLNTELFALRRGAEMVFLNFESGNWYNSLSPAPRDLKIWEPWKRVCKRCSLVLSISKEGEKWARGFYTDCPESTRFDWCYPSINTYAADMASEVQREKRILFFARFSWSEHKGVNQLQEVFTEGMRGYTLALVVGGGEVPAQSRQELEKRAALFGVRIELLSRLSDIDKFIQIKRAELMLFPSFFEGFGYPPIESQYCNTPCVAFDLPVLRETSGDGLIYSRRGDWEDFRRKIQEALSSPGDYSHLRDHIRPVASLESHAERLSTILPPLLQNKKPLVWLASGELLLPADPATKVGVSEPKVGGTEFALDNSQHQLVLRGWYAANSEKLVVSTVNGKPLDVVSEARPDVRVKHPGLSVVEGFSVAIDRGMLGPRNVVEIHVGGVLYWSRILTMACATPGSWQQKLYVAILSMGGWFSVCFSRNRIGRLLRKLKLLGD